MGLAGIVFPEWPLKCTVRAALQYQLPGLEEAEDMMIVVDIGVPEIQLAHQDEAEAGNSEKFQH
jgi:hypothetical protein